MEICDYSTYYQPVVMGDLFGFGRPMDEVGDAVAARHPDHGLGQRRPPDRGRPRHRPRRAADRGGRPPARPSATPTSVSGDVAAGTMGAVRFQVIGKVDGVPRVVVEHVTRTDAGPGPRVGDPARRADGCYRITITGEPMMNVDFTHHGEHGDHNVSGMITTAQRIVNALPAVVAAEPRHRHGPSTCRWSPAAGW